LTDFHTPTSNFTEIHWSSGSRTDACGLTDRRMGMMKLTGAFRDSCKRAYKYPPLLCLFKAVLSATHIKRRIVDS